MGKDKVLHVRIHYITNLIAFMYYFQVYSWKAMCKLNKNYTWERV